jgi:hypothetical protein
MLALAVSAPAQEPRMEDCCLLLLVPVGARSSALGGAVTAWTGPDAVFRNPAGLAGADENMFLVHHADRKQVNVDAFTFLLTPAIGTVALSYQLFDWGTITTTDDMGQITGELSIRNHLLVGSIGRGLGRTMGIGGNYKVFQERIDCRGSCGGVERASTTHAVDLGFRYTPRGQPALHFGASLLNLPLRFDAAGRSERFPSRVHMGLAYDVLQPFRSEDGLALRLAVDLQDELRELGSPVPSVGLELAVQQAIFLRAGYTPGEGHASGAAIGVAMRYDRFDIGVARSFVNSSFEDDEPFQVTFGINF